LSGIADWEVLLIGRRARSASDRVKVKSSRNPGDVMLAQNIGFDLPKKNTVSGLS